MLAGYALDAIDGGPAPPVPFEQADARAFLDEVLGAPAIETGGVALGTEIHFGDDNVTGGALVWEGR